MGGLKHARARPLCDGIVREGYLCTRPDIRKMSLKRKTPDELPLSNHARRLQQLEQSRDVWVDDDAPWAARAPPQLQWDA